MDLSPAQAWPSWPRGHSKSVGAHLGTAASVSEPQDRWCQVGLRPWVGQGSRDEQSLIYAAALDRGLWCWVGRGGPPSAQLTSTGCRSAIGRKEVGWVRQMCDSERVVWSSQGTGFVLWPPGQLQSVQHVCREDSLLNTFHLKPTLKQQSLCLVSIMLNIISLQ